MEPQFLRFDSHNHTAHESLKWRTPIEWLTGSQPDVSVMLQLFWWEPVLHMKEDVPWEESTECLGRMVGIPENVGDAMTYTIMTDNGSFASRPAVRSALKDGGFCNHRAEALAPNVVPMTERKVTFADPDKTIQTGQEANETITHKEDEGGDTSSTRWPQRTSALLTCSIQQAHKSEASPTHQHPPSLLPPPHTDPNHPHLKPHTSPFLFPHSTKG